MIYDYFNRPVSIHYHIYKKYYFYFQCMLDDLEVRLPKSGCQNKLYCFGVLLNPTIRGRILSEFNLLQATTEEMVAENEVITAGNEDLNEAMHIENELDEDDEEAFLTSYSQKGRRQSDEPPASESILEPQTPLQTELSKYLYWKEQLFTAVSVDILGWWKEHQKVYPLLAKCARKYLACQATSCSSERTFSTGGNTVSYKRTKLDPTNVHMLVYCKDNLPKIQIQKLVLEDNEEKDLEEECQEQSETDTD